MKRERLDRATKRAYRAARRIGKRISWKQAREVGAWWCVQMWPDFFNARAA